MSTLTSTPAANAYTSSQYNYLNGTYFPTPFHLQQQPLQPFIGPSPPPIAAPVVPASASGVYSLSQYQQAQQLFQRVAQTITPEAIENVKAAIASSEIEQKAEAKKKAVPRKAAGQTWEDPTLADWPEDDFRIFCGNLGNEVNDDVLSKAFARFPSFNMARKGVGTWEKTTVGHLIPHLSAYISVVRDKRTGKTKGYGFVSFSSPSDLVVALKEMNGMIRYLLKMTGPDWYWMITSNGSGKYVGNRPIQLRKSKWKDRIDYEVLARGQNASPKKAKSPKKSILHK